MAARLAMAVVGHVLYIKEQVPFPVGQLASIPISNPKYSTKKRDELLDTLERLDSQMSSTLQQLSWTLASRFKLKSVAPQDSDSMSSLLPFTTKLHMMILIGSAISAPKARMVLELDRFEARSFDWREDLFVQYPDEDESRSGAAPSLDVDTSQTGDEVNNEDVGSLGKGLDVDSEQHEVDDSESDRSDDEDDDDFDCDSSAETTHGSEDGSAPLSDASDVSEDDEDEDADHLYPSPQSSSTSPSASPPPAFPTPSPPSTTQTRTNALGKPSAESQIRTAERALYRTLASSTSIDELPPTSIHILLRAPRCFKPPPVPKSSDAHRTMWEPIQMYTKTLEDILRNYFDPCPEHKSSISKVKTEGVRVQCQGHNTMESAWNGWGPKVRVDSENMEEDEMIWWQWSGKLKGIGGDIFL